MITVRRFVFLSLLIFALSTASDLHAQQPSSESSIQSNTNIYIPKSDDKPEDWNKLVLPPAKKLLSAEDFQAYRTAINAQKCPMARDILIKRGFTRRYPVLVERFKDDSYLSVWESFVGIHWYPEYGRCAARARIEASRTIIALDRIDPPKFYLDFGVSIEGAGPTRDRNYGLQDLFWIAVRGYLPAVTDILDYERSGDIAMPVNLGLFFRKLLRESGIDRPGMAADIERLRKELLAEKDGHIEEKIVDISVRSKCWSWLLVDCEEILKKRGDWE